MSKKATIIAVVNQKGGTGKTTTTENLGVGLALEGKKVLLVDTDPQASLTVSLGNPCPDELSPTLSDLMGKIMVESPIAPGEGILHHPEGVDLVPSNIELSGMEVALVNAMSRETILRQYLDTVKQNYDYILLDCMPSLGMLTVNALAAADNVLIPVQAAYGKDDLTVRPREDMELADLLREAVTRIGGTYAPAELTEEANSQEKEQITIPARPDVKNFSYTVVDDEVYFRENSVMRLVSVSGSAARKTGRSGRSCGDWCALRLISRLRPAPIWEIPLSARPL